MKYDVKSEMAGTVLSIAVAVGQAVTSDTDLIILEAMKMEIPVTAPSAGKVLALHVSEGAIIAEGDLIATLEN